MSMFRDDFVWGAATASYQIEGAFDADGKGLSVWDMLCDRPGAIFEGHTGKTACDHYNRYPEDVALMSQIGLQAYRFSISWPRVMPEGMGAVNEKGLDFYDRLVDELLAKGIAPYPTLFHWDYPLALYLKGGWMNQDAAKWFGDYAEIMGRRLGDRVSNWMTFNEPSVFLGMGHVTGEHAPGAKLGYGEFLSATKGVQLSHGRAVQALRAAAPQALKIGMAPVGLIGMPATESPEDIAAAKRIGDDMDRPEFWHRSLYLDPVLKGVWPEHLDRVFSKFGVTYSEAELKEMHQPTDWLGLNFYNAAVYRAGEDGEPEFVRRTPGYARTGFNWPVTPEGIYWLVRFHHEIYGLPIVITENGLSSLDWVDQDGRVPDSARIQFTREYLQQLSRAHQEGYDIQGYFHWSFLDNFEWAEGYKHRFGMVHVDFETQKRTIKDSAFWYRKVIETNGEFLNQPLSPSLGQ